MKPLYDVWTEYNENFIMRAPLLTIQNHFGLHKDALVRILSETKDPMKSCTLHLHTGKLDEKVILVNRAIAPLGEELP